MQTRHDQRSHRQTVFSLILLGILCLLAYGNMLGNEFKIDDHKFYNEDFVRQFQSWKDFFTQLPDPRHYFPLNYLVTMALFPLTKSGPFLPHLINLILFYLNCVFLWQIIVLLTRNRMLAFLTSALFCVHPINAIVIGQISLNVIFLCTLFLEFSMIMFWLFVEKQRPRAFYLGMSLFCFAFSLLCFEGTLLFPLHLAVLLFFLKKSSLKEIAVNCFPFWVVSLIYFILWSQFTKFWQVSMTGRADSLALTLGSAIASGAYLIQWYLGNLVYPVDIVWIKNIDPIKESVWGWSALLLAGILGFCLLIWKWRETKPLQAFALAWFFIGFFVMPLAMLGHNYMGLVIEPYWFYFSSIGFFLLLAVAMDRLAFFVSQRIWIFIVAVILLACVFQTRIYNNIAKTEKSYCEFWLRSCPNNPIALVALGKIYADEKEYDQALSYYQKSLAVSVFRAPEINNDIGLIYMDMNRLPEARRHILRSISLDPSYASAYNSLGIVSAKENNFEQAEESFQRALSLDPSLTWAITNLVELYRITGRGDEAIAFLEQRLAQEQSPSVRKELLRGLAVLYFRHNKNDKFFEMLLTIFQEDRDGRDVVSLGRALNEAGFRNGTLAILEQSLKLYPKNQELRLFYDDMAKQN